MDGAPSRFERVRGLLGEHGYEGLLAAGADHVAHLAGYARYLGGPAAVIVLPDDERVLVVPRFELEIARAQTLADRVECYGPADFLEFGLGPLLRERCRGLAGSARVAETADGTLEDELQALRRVKDDDELQRIASSYDAALAAQAAIAAAAAEGATEIELFSHGRAVAERHLGAPVEYVTTVASGAGSALVSPPMHVAGAVRVGIEDVLLVDVAVRHAGYWGDSARTTVPAEHAGTVAALESIKTEAARELRPGRRASEIYEGVRAAIASAFPGHGLPHHAGHGVGIAIGEDPQLIPTVALPLEAGMVLALEPGIYVPGRFGVRVEDLYVVTPDGGVSLQDGGGDVTFAIVVALLTPFRDDGAVDLETLGAHVGWLAREGVDGFLVGGTTSEGPLLSAAELDASVATTVAANAGRARVIAQVGAPGTAETIARLRAATAAGADAAAAVGPYYYHLTQEQLLAHYRALLAAAGRMPLLAYNIPSRTVNDLLPPMIATLAREGLAGIKDSTKSLERLGEYLAAAPHDAGFEVFAGSDSLAAPARDAGAHGIVSAIANADPDLLRAVRDAPDGDALERAQQALTARRSEIQRDGSLATLKSATAGRLDTAGIRYPTAMRAPLS